MRKLMAVSFNLSDDEESKIYEHAMKEKYFSRYVKKLIAQDMGGERVEWVERESAPIEEPTKKPTPRGVQQDNEDDVFNFF